MNSCCQDCTCPASRHQCQTQARRPRALRRLVAPSGVSEPDLRVPPLGQHRGFWTTSSQQNLDRVRSSTADRFGTSASHASASDSTPILDRAAVQRATVVLAVARAQPSSTLPRPRRLPSCSPYLLRAQAGGFMAVVREHLATWVVCRERLLPSFGTLARNGDLEAPFASFSKAAQATTFREDGNTARPVRVAAASTADAWVAAQKEGVGAALPLAATAENLMTGRAPSSQGADEGSPRNSSASHPAGRTRRKFFCQALAGVGEIRVQEVIYLSAACMLLPGPHEAATPRLLAEMRLFRLWLSAQHLARLKGLSCKASREGFDSKLVCRFWLPKRQPGLARLRGSPSSPPVGTFNKAATCASCSLASAGQPRLCKAVLASLLQLCLLRLPVRRPLLLRIGCVAW